MASDLLIRLARRWLAGVRIGIAAWHFGATGPLSSCSPVNAGFRAKGKESVLWNAFEIPAAAKARA